MCLILFAWRTHPEYRLVVAANRDEFYFRATEPLHWWHDTATRIAAGRDGAGGGTWMGVSGDGRFAAVTNVREGAPTGSVPAGMRSRGELPVGFLDSAESPGAVAARVLANGAAYQGFNLLVADANELWWTSNRAPEAPQRVSPGVHGLSNAALDTAWPKVCEGTAEFAAALATDDGCDEATARYFELLADTRRAPWKMLPHTGVQRIAERRLSARFVDMGDYGTRAGTVLRIREDGSFEVTEHRFGRMKRAAGATSLSSPVPR